MRQSLLLVSLLTILLPALQVLGEETPSRPREAVATEILRGRVTEIYTKAIDRKNSVLTNSLVEFVVTDVERGADVKAGDVVYVRAFAVAAKPGQQMPTGSSGHNPIPKEGDRVRAFIVRGPYSSTSQTDSGRSAVYADGFEILK